MYFLTMLEMVHFDILVHSNQSNDIKNLLKDISEQSVYLYLYLCNLHEANKYIKTKHALLYDTCNPGPELQKKWSWRHMKKCWLKLNIGAADQIWNALIQVKAQHYLIFCLRSHTLRHSGCEILKSNVLRQLLHYWSQKLLL